MPGLDNNIIVNVSGDSPPLAAASFGGIIVACVGLGGGFTERVRYYEDSASAVADADLTSSARAAVAACFSQALHVPRIGIARVDALVAQVTTIEITTEADGVWELDFTAPDGTAVNKTYTASGSATAAAIATGLRATFSGGGAVAGVTVGGTGADVTLTVATAGDADIEDIVVTEPGSGVATVTEDTAGVTLAAQLSAILAADSSWYVLHLETRNVDLIARAAAWMESNGKFLVAQCSQSSILAATAGNLAETLQDLAYARTALAYHATDSEWMMLAQACFFFQSNPDINATIGSYKTLVGAVANTSLTSGQIGNLKDQACNFYSTLQGTSVFFGGVVSSGLKWDQRLARDWLKARAEEAIAGALIKASNANSKIPFTARGLEQLRGVIATVAARGVNAGHFDGDTPPVTTTVTPAGADKANRQARYRCVVVEAGAVELVTLDAYISL